MKDELRFRLIYTRGKLKNIMVPEFRTVVDIPEGTTLKGTFEVTGSKEVNGNIDIRFKPFFETDVEREARLKKGSIKPLSERKPKK